MSKKSSKGPKAKAPRKMEDIQNEYGRLLSQAGNAAYLVHVYEEELRKSNERLREVNQEAAKRQELDRQAEAAAKQQAEIKADSEVKEEQTNG